jgi:hypothetical protein
MSHVSATGVRAAAAAELNGNAAATDAVPSEVKNSRRRIDIGFSFMDGDRSSGLNVALKDQCRAQESFMTEVRKLNGVGFDGFIRLPFHNVNSNHFAGPAFVFFLDWRNDDYPVADLESSHARIPTSEISHKEAQKAHKKSKNVDAGSYRCG